MTLTRHSVLLALALFGACNSKVTSTVDLDLQKKVNTVQDCFPNLYARASDLLDIANTWRMNSGTSIADPGGLSWAEQGDGSIDVTYVVNGTTIMMTIVFYSPAGVAQDLNLGSASTLADAVDAAATQLRTNFSSGDPFLVGAWIFAGGGISGSGALTGIIGGSGSGNELLELRTTEAAPAGGPPAVATSTIVDNGPPVCTLTFSTSSLITDQSNGQLYPQGVIEASVAGPDATVAGSITFDTTSTARVAIASISGHFDLNLVTFAITYVP